MKEGRIMGRVNGAVYELVQYGEVRQSIPLVDAYQNEALLKAIVRNKWESLP